MMLVIAILAFSSCELEDEEPTSNGDTKNKPVDLLNTKKWERIANHQEMVSRSAGGYNTQALRKQKNDELCWYLYYPLGSAISIPNDIVLNTKNKVTVTKPSFKFEETIREVKGIFDTNVWEITLAPNNSMFLYKNDVKLGKGARHLTIQPSADGFFSFNIMRITASYFLTIKQVQKNGIRFLP
jgi:hypothetical protein